MNQPTGWLPCIHAGGPQVLRGLARHSGGATGGELDGVKLSKVTSNNSRVAARSTMSRLRTSSSNKRGLGLASGWAVPAEEDGGVV